MVCAAHSVVCPPTFRNCGTPFWDRKRHFLNPRVHSLLRKLVSQSDLALVHRPKFRTEKSPSIKLLSDSELQAVKTFSKVLTAQKLQMPPVMNPRVDNLEENIIVRDPNLCGLLPGNQKLVFVDIGLESTRRQRLMVIREADGTLRHANASERDRLNQVYFPLPGRRLRVPSMLRTPNFEATLRSGRHEYILDRLLAQFEPDDPEYIRLCHAVYDDAEARIWSYYNAENTGGSFSTSADETEPTKHVVTRLRYTRHYGPFALYVIASLGRPESLLQEALSHQAFDTAEHILHLNCILQPQSEAAEALNKRHNFPSCLDHENNDESQPLLKRHIERTLELVRTFIESSNLMPEKKTQLELTLLQCQQSSESEPSKKTSFNQLLKEAKFYISLAYGTSACYLGLRTWYDRITDRLILGGLPVLSKWEEIQKRETITHVVSLLEPFEVKSFVLGPAGAASRGLNYLSLPVADFTGVPTTSQASWARG
ncbi:hypothetical protein AAHC03_01280 [Spirometra sp. Aus1]